MPAILDQNCQVCRWPKKMVVRVNDLPTGWHEYVVEFNAYRSMAQNETIVKVFCSECGLVYMHPTEVRG